MTLAAIWIGGSAPVEAALENLPAFDVVLAADSGLNAACDAGHRVDIVVGDMDSVRAELLDAFEGEVLRFTPNKDYTDLELALDVAVERGASEILVIGGGGGRLDHEVGGLLVLTLHKYATAKISARIGQALVAVVRDRVDLVGSAGDVVSLVPVTDSVEGVTTDGLRWPLERATLTRGATWSTSNEFLGESASVTVEDGIMLVIQPLAFAESG